MKTKLGFTLIELLMVICIIALLSALLFPVVNKAKRSARFGLGVAEVIQIQQAVAAYVRDTHGGPKFGFVAGPDNIADSDIADGFLESDGTYIAGDLARILAGEDIKGNNPAKRRYMEFKHLDEKGEPVTPWWRPGTSQSQINSYRYRVKIDGNFDDQINAGTAEPQDPPASAVRNSVIVWAYNLDKPTTDQRYLIRSWEQ